MIKVKFNSRIIKTFKDDELVGVNIGETKKAKDLKIGDCMLAGIVIGIKHSK